MRKFFIVIMAIALIGFAGGLAHAEPGFDYRSYLAANPDLPQTWGQAASISHYIHHGFFAKRAVAFNIDEYLNANPDLPGNWTFEEGLNHYHVFGKHEHRLLAFDGQEYLSLYSDLPQNWTYDQAYQHFLYFGQYEGRIPSFDEAAYLEMYPDLPRSWEQAESFFHYLNYGQFEGRAYDPYDESVFSLAGKDAWAVSFSPTTERDSAGNLIPLNWRYRVNNGNMQINVEGLPLIFSFSDIQLSINPDTLVRQGNFSGRISGAASGTFSARFIENLSSLNGKTLVEAQDIEIDLALAAEGESVGISIDVNTDWYTPVEWFLDRNDLDQMPINYTYDENGRISGNAYAEVVVTGDLHLSDSFSSAIFSAERWEITGHRDSMFVNGTWYYDIVEVTRTTVVPEYANGSIQEKNAQITYWVARGIGMLKSIGHFNFLGQPLTVELVSTNLTQLLS